MSSRKICDECAGFAFTRSCHPVVPRRAITAVRGSPGPSSKPMAMSAAFAAATSASRAAAERLAGQLLVAGHDDAQVQRVERAGGLQAPSARWIITTSPPFMSMMPGPRARLLVDPLEALERAVRLEHGVEMADEQDARARARRARATRCPARLNAAPSTHRVVKPSASSSARNTSPTARTPAKFIVPLLMLTTRSSSASACGVAGVDGGDDRLFFWRQRSSSLWLARRRRPRRWRIAPAAAPCRAPAPPLRRRTRAGSCRRCRSACDSRHDPRRRSRGTARAAAWNGP